MLRKFTGLSLVVLALSLLIVGMAAAQEATEEAAEEAALTSGPLMDVTNEYTIATVVKLTGIAWFDRMEEGIAQFGEDYPTVTAFQQGPAQADAALQVQVLEDLIAQDVDALCVIPFQPETLEPVLERAREQGIVVITHEASNQQNIDYDIEAFDNSAYGRHLMDHLAERMGGEGEYAVFVGSLTSATHNQWVDAAIEHQQENYPNMTLVGDKNESFDDPQVAYERMQELLVTYPNLRGVQGSASTDVAGVGQAVEEAGLEDQIAVVGTSLPSIAGDLIETGAVDLISFWDPALAGYACNQIALMQLEGMIPEEIANGELPADGFGFENVAGYEEMTLDGKVFYGAAWVDVTAENLAEWDF
jgi:simple sugar transport system substrate-binding protein